MELLSIYGFNSHYPIVLLYDLLGERTPDQSISHKSMPTINEHSNFVLSRPYKRWDLIYVEDHGFVGAIYLTYVNEIGIGVLRNHQGHHYGIEAVRLLMAREVGPFLANINPNNQGSIAMFAKLGFGHIQNTYRHE